MSEHGSAARTYEPEEHSASESVPSPLPLFAGFGIELEYMIVDQTTLNVAPIADKLLQQVSGNLSGDAERGAAGWSNELVLHVIEMKTNGPADSLIRLDELFSSEINHANTALASFGAKLLPTAMHPWMSPDRDTKLWPHDNNEIYQAYDRIFSCKGHGWSNLQSMHINLPFANDDEFGRLHAAIRLVLPILPMIAASSPVVEGKFSGFTDARLNFYRNNQRKIPEVAGRVIPEPVFTRVAYEQEILARTYAAIAPYDKVGMLQEEWLNSRGAIARFDRHAIEIRLIDIQECPKADLAIAALVVGLVRMLTEERHLSYSAQREWAVDPLLKIFDGSVLHGSQNVLMDQNYLRAFGYQGQAPVSCREFFEHLINDLFAERDPAVTHYRHTLFQLATLGTLAQRIKQAVGPDCSHESLRRAYGRLSDCLTRNELFHGSF